MRLSFYRIDGTLPVELKTMTHRPLTSLYGRTALRSCFADAAGAERCAHPQNCCPKAIRKRRPWRVSAK